MTETIEPTTSDAGSNAAAPKKKSGGLNTMLLADLKSMAGGLGIRGTGSMKKAQLVEAIKAAQSGGQSGGESGGRPTGTSKSASKAEVTPDPTPDSTPDSKRESKRESKGDSRPGRRRPR